jgi:hypothetical protein
MRERERETLDALAPSLLLTLTIFVFLPALVYGGNVGEFSFGYFDLLAVYAIPAAVTLLVLFGIGLWSRRAVRARFNWVIGASAILLWFQAQVLVRDYGLLDGTTIDWMVHGAQAWIDGAIWIGVIVFALMIAPKAVHLLAVICWVFVAVQGVELAAASMSSGDRFWTKDAVPRQDAPAGIFEYSSKRNVIHVLFDHFQTDVFLEVLEEEGWAEEFSGFTVFEENIGTLRTSLSLPALFSGRLYEGDGTVEEYYQTSVGEASFHHVLAAEDYVVNVVPHMAFPEGNVTNTYRIPATYGGESADEVVFEASYLMDIALFRAMPQSMKKFIYNENNWRISGIFSKPPAAKALADLAFFQSYTGRIRVAREQYAYHFMHLYPPHPPYVLNDDGVYTGVLPATRENYKVQARHTLRVFIKFLRRLSELGVYDSSLIVLHSDHGSEFPPVQHGQAYDIGLRRVPALLAIKPVSQRTALQVSNAPTAITDIGATILDHLGLDWSGGGESILRVDSLQNRERRYLWPLDGSRGGVGGYSIVGSIYHRDAWRPIESIEPADESSLSPYEWGSSIRFGVTGNAGAYKAEGWAGPDDAFEWTNGDTAAIELLVEEPSDDLRLTMLYRPLLATGRVSSQRVRLAVNGVQVGSWTADSTRFRVDSVMVPQELLHDHGTSHVPMRIALDLPDAIAPSDLGTSPDGRRLALAVRSMVIDPRPDYEWGTTIMFGDRGGAGGYLAHGWGMPERGFRWTDGQRAMIELPIAPLSGDALLEMRLWPFLAPGRVDRQTLTLLANGSEIAEWNIRDAGAQELAAVLPAELLGDATLKIEFLLPDARAPKELGLSNDDRVLGVAVQSVTIRDAHEADAQLH